MSLRAVIFDIDGVLMDSREANIAWYRAFLATRGYPGLSEAQLARGHYYSLREAIAYLTEAPEDEVDRLWEEARGLEGYPYELVRLPESCEDCLTELTNDYALAIVTSRIAEGIEQFFDFSGLRGLFPVIVGYEDSVRHKPDAEPLLVACGRLGVTPSEAAYIGDAESDRLAAESAGVHFVAYGEAIACARHRACSFNELAGLLRMLPG